MAKKKKQINLLYVLKAIIIVIASLFGIIFLWNFFKNGNWNPFVTEEDKKFTPNWLLIAQSRLTDEEAEKYALLLHTAMSGEVFKTDSDVITEILLTTPFEENDYMPEAYNRFEFGAAELEHISLKFGKRSRSPIFGKTTGLGSSMWGFLYLDLGQWLEKESSKVQYQAISERYFHSSVFQNLGK